MRRVERLVAQYAKAIGRECWLVREPVDASRDQWGYFARIDNPGGKSRRWFLGTTHIQAYYSVRFGAESIEQISYKRFTEKGHDSAQANRMAQHHPRIRHRKKGYREFQVEDRRRQKADEASIETYAKARRREGKD